MAGSTQAWAKRAASAGVIAMLAGLAACHDDTPAMRAVNNASKSIDSVAGGAEAAVAVDVQEKAFKDAIKQLNEVKLDPSNPLASAVGVLTGASKLGEAGASADAAQASLGRISALRGEVRSAVRQWSTYEGIAASAKYNPAPKTTELDAQLTASKGEMAQAQEKLAKLQADQDKMRAAARDKGDQAAKFDLESVRLKEEARKLSAEASQPVLARALEAKAKADELKLAVAKTEADALLFEPRKLEVAQKIEELEIGIKSMEEERARAVKRGEQSGAIAKSAKDKADEVAKAIEKSVKALAEEREKLNGSFEAVMKNCREAQTAAAAAKDSPGRAVSAQAKLRLGEVMLVKAAESGEQATLMGELAALALPGASAYAEQAKAAKEAAESTKAEAKGSIEGARSDYKSLKVKGDMDATRAALLKHLTQLGGLEPDPDEAAPAADGGVEKKDEGAGDAKPAGAASAEEAPIRELLAKLKEGGLESASSLARVYFDPKGPVSPEALKAPFEAAGKLDEACKTKFGKSWTESKKDAGGLMQIPGILDLRKAEVEKLTIKVDGDKATASDEGGASMQLIKDAGEWKVDLSPLSSMLSAAAGGDAEKLGALIAAQAAAIDAVRQDVEAGKLEKIEDVDAAVQAKMQEAMMKAMMPAGGGKSDEGAGKGGGAGG